jgi:hypothetical protein
MADSENKLYNVANNTVRLQIFVAYVPLISFFNVYPCVYFGNLKKGRVKINNCGVTVVV